MVRYNLMIFVFLFSFESFAFDDYYNYGEYIDLDQILKKYLRVYMKKMVDTLLT